MTERETICRNCVVFRKEAGLTQEQVAQAIEFSIDAVRSWEQGRKAPERDALAGLARLYGRTMDDFFSDKPPPPKAEGTFVDVRFKSHGLDADLQREAEEYARRLKQKQLDRIIAEKAKAKDRRKK